MVLFIYGCIFGSGALLGHASYPMIVEDIKKKFRRRAERAISGLLEDQPELGKLVLPYMNRLSDLLFVLARAANREAGVQDPEWRPRS